MFRQMFVFSFLVFSVPIYAQDNEPFCLSRYDYDYKMLQKTVSMEQELNNMKQLLDKQSNINRNLELLIDRMKEDYKENFHNLEQQLQATTMITGSVYIRWGATECPGNGTETVYAGYAGGSHYMHVGAAAKPLCLPSDPLWGDYDDRERDHSYIYGAEYELPSGLDKTIFKKSLYENDVPCAVCHSIRSSVVMIPARSICYSGWTAEYTGYIMSGHYKHNAATEYICMDGDPEVIPGGQSNKDGKLFYLTEAYCGSLKCPPYVQGREFPCVVCTK